MALQKVGHGQIGKIPYGAGAEGFLLVVTDYFSKWVEVEALSWITDLQIRKFLWTNVITHSHEIVTVETLKKKREWSSIFWVVESRTIRLFLSKP